MKKETIINWVALLVYTLAVVGLTFSVTDRFQEPTFVEIDKPIYKVQLTCTQDMLDEECPRLKGWGCQYEEVVVGCQNLLEDGEFLRRIK